MKTTKSLTILFAALFVLSCTQPPVMQINQERFIYVTKNTFAGDFNAGMEIHGDGQWNGDLREATHVVFDTIDQVGNIFPVIDTIYARGHSNGANFNYKLGRQPTQNFRQYTVEDVVEVETSGVFRYGVRYGVSIVW